MAQTGNGGAAAGDSADGPSFRVLTQFIKDLSFEVPNGARAIQAGSIDAALKIEVNVGARKAGDDIYESGIQFAATAKTDQMDLYTIEIEYAGVFQIKNIPDQQLEPVLLINCPMLLFPFLRRIAADLTRESNFVPLNLDPIDFAALYTQRKREQAAGGKAPGAASKPS